MEIADKLQINRRWMLRLNRFVEGGEIRMR